MLFLERIYWQGLQSWLSSIFNWVKNCPGGFPTIFTQHFERSYDLHMTLSIYDILSESDIINLHDRRARLETNYESNFNIEDIMYLTFIRFTAPHIIFFYQELATTKVLRIILVWLSVWLSGAVEHWAAKQGWQVLEVK